MEEGVDQGGKRLRPREQRSTFSQQRQHGCAQISVKGECHVCGTESSLTQIQRKKTGVMMEKCFKSLLKPS